MSASLWLTQYSQALVDLDRTAARVKRQHTKAQVAADDRANAQLKAAMHWIYTAEQAVRTGQGVGGLDETVTEISIGLRTHGLIDLVDQLETLFFGPLPDGIHAIAREDMDESIYQLNGELDDLAKMGNVIRDEIIWATQQSKSGGRRLKIFRR